MSYALLTADDALIQSDHSPIFNVANILPGRDQDAGEIVECTPRFGAPRRPIGESEYTVRPEQIGYHIYYGGGGEYLYQPVPKCACTTIKTLLLQIEGLPVDKNHWRRHQKEYNKFPGTNHLTLREQLDIFEGRTDTFKFVVVRNPYARLASAYTDKILVNPAPHLIRKIRKSAAEQGTVLSDPITFEQFVSVVSRQSLKDMDPHCRPQYYEGRFGLVKYDFVGRMESTHRDLVYAFKRIGAPESLIARVDERHNVAGSTTELWETLSPEVLRLFLTTFEIDFDTLQYSRELSRSAHNAAPKSRVFEAASETETVSNVIKLPLTSPNVAPVSKAA